MAGQLQQVGTGQLFLPSAADWNRRTQAAKQAEQIKLDGGPTTVPSDRLPSGIVLVKNTTDSTLLRGSILGLGTPIILPSLDRTAFLERIAFTGVTPTLAHAGKFCVLAEPLAAGALGRAWIDGTPQVEIEVTSTSHKFAEVSTTTARLKSAVRGSAKILWAESGIGNKPAIVRLVAESTGGNGDSEGASCGCCDPTNCAAYTQPLSNSDCEEGPFGWEVNFGSAVNLESLCSGLAVDDSGSFELEYIGYGVWKSAAFTCLGSALVGGCNDEGGTADCCSGSAVMQPDGSSGWTEATNDCSDGCTGQVPGSTSDGQSSVTVPCTDNVNYDIYISMDGFEWTRTGGNCEVHTVPDHVVYPPLDPGDIRHFPCCDSDPTLPTGDQYAWVQLTVNNTRDSENRSSTTLELIVGGVAAFTYVLPIGKDFCCTCEQKFELRCCGPWAFRYLPESLCLRPMTPLDFDELYVDSIPGFSCCMLRPADDKLPRFYEFEVALTDGTHGCCAGNASGQFILEWRDDPFAAAWDTPPMVECPINSIPGPFPGDCRATTPPGEPPGSGDNSQSFYQWVMGCSSGTLSLGFSIIERCTTPTIGGECTAYCATQQVFYTADASAQLCDSTEGILFTYAGGAGYCSGYPLTIRVFPMVT